MQIINVRWPRDQIVGIYAKNYGAEVAGWLFRILKTAVEKIKTISRKLNARDSSETVLSLQMGL